MARRSRLDAELVRRGLARSRQHAAELIDAGRVLLDGSPASKPATQLDPARPVRVLEASDGRPEYASRGGHKLAGALDALGVAAPTVSGRRALDAGASTGGFTDVLLRRGAAHVIAVDVGYGQLAWALRTDERVTVMDRTNVRALEPAQVDPPSTSSSATSPSSP
ncbi:SAM-dependent methyltransferase [Ruania alba]|uniref:SAM-dependent methyltransferase n=1 Tax=Ruania alba TaxID=648782 RepID=UPI000B2E0FD6